jgi:hypothetical protein
MGQKSVTVDDLLALSTLSPKNFDNYMEKKGYVAINRGFKDNATAVTFSEKRSFSDSNTISRTVDVYKKENAWCFLLETSSKQEFQDGMNTLKKFGFFYDNIKDTSQPSAILFQKGGVSVISNAVVKDEGQVYTFLLEKKNFPDPGNVQYGEDLLKFDSHEHLASYFGEGNVKKDVYYFSEQESKNCSVLFPNSSRQAVFIWDDEINLYKVSFVIISGNITTASSATFSGNFSQNAWKLKSGIYSGMRIKDLLKLNANDFNFYGRDSEFSFMIVPEKTRYIDFTRVGVMLDCFDCRGSSLLDAAKVSAADAADHELALFVSCIMISQ